MAIDLKSISPLEMMTVRSEVLPPPKVRQTELNQLRYERVNVESSYSILCNIQYFVNYIVDWKIVPLLDSRIFVSELETSVHAHAACVRSYVYSVIFFLNFLPLVFFTLFPLEKASADVNALTLSENS